MEVSFNELSICPLLANKYKANDRMVLFAQMIAEVRRRGFRRIRTHFSASEIQLTADYSFHNWQFDKDFSPEHRAIFYDMLIRPFIRDDEEIEKMYIEANYYFEDAVNGIPKQECLGLASAYLAETIAVSFQSNQAWLKNKLNIIVEKEGEISYSEVNHVYSKDCFTKESICNFIEEISILTLLETDIAPNQKKLHLTSHHGEKELSDLWYKIKHSPHTIAAMSIEWGGNSFYKNPQANGMVDIVHLKSDKRYALQVKTTGRNLRETTAIANILEEKYS